MGVQSVTTIMQLIIAILIGAFIGWITNLIAIKGLFHPRNPFMGYQGLLPKRKADLADNLGDMVEGNLINIPELIEQIKPEDINIHLERLVDNNRNEIKKLIRSYVRNFQKRALKWYVDSSNNIKPEQINPYLFKFIDRHRDEIFEIIYERLNSLNNTIFGGFLGLHGLSNQLTDIAIEELKNKVSKSSVNLIPKIGKEVKNYVSVRDFVKLKNDYIEKLTNYAVNELKTRIKAAAPNLLNKVGNEIVKYIKVKDIVRDKVNQMDLDKLEGMIYKISSQEMKAIEYLGGILGGVVGALQWVIQYYCF